MSGWRGEEYTSVSHDLLTVGELIAGLHGGSTVAGRMLNVYYAHRRVGDSISFRVGFVLTPSETFKNV